MEKLLKNLEQLGFSLKSGEEFSYSKSYNGYEIKITYNEQNPDLSVIYYGKKITIGRQTTCNFRQEENFVVLECVNRLLEKGYKPESIELEKQWNLGHKGKGFLDILVKNNKKQSFLMIECKTWGNDYETEKKNTLNKSKRGSQIFSYLHQEPRTTKAVCLYTYNPAANLYKNAIVYNKEDWVDLNQEERYNRWFGKFEENGIFEEWVEPYSLTSKAILRRDLKPLTQEDGDNIYNKFAEILRHNVISDKSTAFNKIINLFLCKIYDEDTDENSELTFQTRKGTESKSDEELLLDLSDLYLKGMEHYLGKKIEDVSIREFENIATNSNKDELMKVYCLLRLYKDNVFGFREVFDKQSFIDNAKVVREIVELLQDKQLRYSHKQQFLGDFFENLLKDSIKQESGQYFTPVPITQFIISSLPIHEIIDANIKSSKNDILPYTIDFAMGAGHFLTEIMDEYNNIVKQLPVEKISKTSRKDLLKSWKDYEFAWAKDYIYGIDLDYRLVKTSKIACFLNGDGLAHIIHADGLDSFSKSKTYTDKLHSDKSRKDNAQFDILVSNPPYSVKAFRNTINDGENSFELYSSLTDNSSEIECLFVERAKQLLKEGAVAGIILPVSIMTNGGIYEKTREMLLKYFEFKAILALGSQAFAATGTKTIILFLKRRSNFAYVEIEGIIDTFLLNYKNVAVNGIAKAFSVYAKTVYEELDFDSYVNLLKGVSDPNIQKSDIGRDYSGLSSEQIKEIEKSKLSYFMLAYPQKIVLAEAGEKEEEKLFYGYEFSNRRGYEGIHIYRDNNGDIKTKLYDPNNKKNNDKLNSYILRNYNGENVEKDIEVIALDDSHPLKGHISCTRLSELMSFGQKFFDKSINLNAKKKIKFDSKYPLIRLGDDKIASIEKGSSITIKNVSKGDVPVVAGGMAPAYYHNKANRSAGIVTISASGAYAGFVNYFDIPIFASDCSTVKSLDENKISTFYIYNILKSVQSGIFALQSGNAQPHVYPKDIALIKIPLPPASIQKKIEKEIKSVNNMRQKYCNLIQDKRRYLQDIIDVIYKNCSEYKKIIEVVIDGKIKSGGTPSTKISQYWNGGIKWATLADVKNKYLYDTQKKITEEGLKKSAELLPVNTIIFSSRATIGEVSILKVPAATNQGFKNIICDRAIMHYELMYYIMKREAENIAKSFTKTKYPEVNARQLGNYKIPVLPLPEQNEVVEKLLELEKEITYLEEITLTLESQTQSILDKYLK